MERLSKEQKNLMEKLKKEVVQGGYSTISLKMKDIVFCQPFSQDYEIFSLMQDDFGKMSKVSQSFIRVRKNAEEVARKKKKYPSLDDIYGIISKTAKLKPHQTEILRQTECDLFTKFCTPRLCGTQILTSIPKNKKIIITADTVYPREISEKILEKCVLNNIPDFRCELVVPHECDGDDIFEMIIQKSECPTEKILHIGGDVAEDVEKPILRGAKSLLIAPPVPLMVKSGRLRGFLQAKLPADYDSEKYRPLRYALGLYCSNCFGVPRSKSFHSDFCGDSYMMGFAVLGTLSLIKHHEPADSVENSIIKALGKNPDSRRGKDDFIKLFENFFGDIPLPDSENGCELPIEFLKNHSLEADRQLLREYMPADDFKKWAEMSCEPQLSPVGENFHSGKIWKIADTLFPSGTKVRRITENILDRIKFNLKLK